MGMPSLLSGGRRRLFFYLVANGFGQALIAVLTALLVRHGFDQLVMRPDALKSEAAILLPLAMVATVLATAWLRWRGNIDGERLGQGYVHAVRMRLFRHLTTIGAEGARRMSRGALVLRFVGDLTALRNWVSLGLARLTVSGLATGLALLALTLVEPVIAIAVAVSMLVTGSLIFTVGPRLRHRTREVRRHRGRIAALINDRISHIGVVEVFGQEQREIKRVRRASKRLRGALIQRARVVGLLRALSEASAGFASMCALVVGALQVAAGQATAGAVVSAMVIAGLLASRLHDLSRVYEYWNAAGIAREKQQQVLRLTPVGRSIARRVTRTTSTNGPELAGIELRNVSKPPLFESLDLTITPGERVAIIGANGAGKSTLLRMLCGLVEPESGKALLGGKEMCTHSWDGLRRNFAMVSPDLPLLRGSLRLNLTYGAPGTDEKEIMRVAHLCGLMPLVTGLQKGLDSRIFESGAGLSTGERARIALARALLARPSVLILDEAEANLDGPSRRTLDEVIDAFDGTVIYATHDLERAIKAERILVVDGGRLIGLTASEAQAYRETPPQGAGNRGLKLVS